MAYKTFANGFPLPASDLNNYLMNQSVIVFADSTARTAALPTPTEGMITYLEDTNTVEVYDGAAWTDINDNTAAIPKSTVTTAGDLIVADGASSVTRLGVGSDGSLLTVDSGSPAYLAPGTDDQVLTLVSGAPAWADAGGGGGGTQLLASGTFSGNTAITSIDQTYKKLILYCKDVYRSSNFGMNFKSSSTAQEMHFWKQEYNGSSWSADQSSNQSSIFFSNYSNLSPGNGDFYLEIFDYSSTSQKSGRFQGFPQLSNLRILYGGMGFDGGGAIDEITIFVDSGNYELYGVS